MDEALSHLFQDAFHTCPTRILRLGAAGSNRQYFRVSDDRNTAIGAIGESVEENDAFIYLARHFERQGLPTPKVLAVSHDRKAYLQEDLGDLSLYDFVKSGIPNHAFNERQWKALNDSIALLPQMQFLGARGLDFSQCYPQACFDRRSIMWDLNYFKYCFLRATSIPFLETTLENDFELLANDLLEQEDDNTHTFLYRDFQSRNVMLKDSKPFFIDFQGGRRGPILYDVASFVFQARLRLTEEQRDSLIQTYLTALRSFRKVNEESFKRQLSIFVFFRMLQTLGAYGFRGFFERKDLFLNAIPPAIDNLHTFISSHADFAVRYPHLVSILHEVIAKNQEDKRPTTDRFDGLTVEVLSFSFKKGIPADSSGNGGGYVFDCRGMHNPGRYDEYKTLTGFDQPVIDFLLERGEVQQFLNHVYALAEPHVSRYVARGFTHLSFAFGCTGGQHRSVFCAQSLARHLHERFPSIRVVLTHRERNIKETLNPTDQ